MTRMAAVVDLILLQEIVDELEEDGPLHNWNELVKSAHMDYHDQKDDCMPEVSTSVIGARIKEHCDNVQTTPGKKGRPAAKELVVDDARIRKSVATAEKDGPCKNLTTLWTAAVEAYNHRRPKRLDELDVPKLKKRAKELEVEIKTKSGKGKGIKGRKATPINLKVLKKCVADAEKDGPKPNLNQLYTCVCECYNEKSGDDFNEVSAAQISKAIADNGIKIKTKVGMKGKAAIEVNQELLTTAIETVEADGPIAEGMTVMWNRVTEWYNANLTGDLKEISYATAIGRAKKWGITPKTQPKRRHGNGAAKKEAKEKAVKERRATMVYGTPGPNRKRCPACEQFIDIHCLICVCGETFADAPAPKPEKEKKHNGWITDAMAREEAYGQLFAKTFGWNRQFICTPAGTPPARLPSDLDYDGVAGWAERCMQRSAYTPSALKYFMRMPLGLQSDEYKAAVALLDEYVQHRLASNGGEVAGEYEEPGDFDDDDDDFEEVDEVKFDLEYA